MCELFKHQYRRDVVTNTNLTNDTNKETNTDCTDNTDKKANTNLTNDTNDAKEPEIRVIGIRHGEKMYETLLTKEEAAKAIDMGNFYAVPADNRDLNYDKYFKEGDTKRALIDEFNSNNTKMLNLEETKEKIASLTYIQNELNGIPNLV